MKRASILLIGPWNFHSGAGQACRGNLKALWRLQETYDIYPLGLDRYGPHRLYTSIEPSTDPTLAPDVAIIHLNPDTAPTLLTREHRRLIEAAKHRVGYWLWETLQVPHSWSSAFAWIDSLWVPSRYCADLFAGLTNTPISIIPHVIDNFRGSNQDAHRNWSAPHTGKVLYIFDGASYLRRKNPTALVRAFHKSGLADQGWLLQLKTKNLNPAGYDEDSFSEFQRALDDLRNSHPKAVELIIGEMEETDLRELISSADIYASPHASEGFGLTIAEAMAAGVVVVATDYGGSRDLLDATTGFPVRYKLHAEEHGFGSYHSGSVWAKPDETHLAECLMKAATAIQTPHGAMLREAAQRKAFDHCGVASVATRMHTALNQLSQ